MINEAESDILGDSNLLIRFAINPPLTNRLLPCDVEAEYNSQKYTVEIETDAKTGRIVGERWRDQHGRLDRPGDLPAYVDYCPETGVAIYQRWHREGMAHRDADLPQTVVTRAKTGIIVGESYCKLDELHRDGDKPASISRDERGRVIEQEYFAFGQRHRDQGPAVERFSVVSGKLLKCEYWCNGKHRFGSNPPTLAPS